jgi:hypothetical protein
MGENPSKNCQAELQPCQYRKPRRWGGSQVGIPSEWCNTFAPCIADVSRFLALSHDWVRFKSSITPQQFASGIIWDSRFWYWLLSSQERFQKTKIARTRPFDHLGCICQHQGRVRKSRNCLSRAWGRRSWLLKKPFWPQICGGASFFEDSPSWKGQVRGTWSDLSPRSWCDPLVASRLYGASDHCRGPGGFFLPHAFWVLNRLNHAFFWGMALTYFDPHPGGIWRRGVCWYSRNYWWLLKR